ncbi:MAG: transporter substrate-binding domain-containing protein [Candidatus Puniceispirillum sp.]
MANEQTDMQQILAPTGVLRAGINLSNFLLVSSRSDDGTPCGISPDMAAWVAEDLGVPCALVTFERPGKLADAAIDNLWDIGNIAFEAERAQVIDFSNAYVVIDANFLLKPNIAAKTNVEIDRPGVTIAVSERSAYDLWLSDNFTKARIIRAPSIAAAHQMFNNGDVDVLASLKPKLLEELATTTSYRMIDEPFTAVKQSIGVKKGQPQAVAYLNRLIARKIRDGSIAGSLEKHGVTGKLTVPTSDET